MLLTSVLRIMLTRSFKPFLFQGIFNNQLDFEPVKELGLYVHIPFCKSLCSFCPYCKYIYNKKEAHTYKTALLKEIDLACNHLSGKKQTTSLYFGGGTPALMIDDLKEIVDYLMRYFTITGGIGVELHPDDITEINVRKLKSAGITMVSIGIQSFDPGCLQKLGRSSNAFAEKVQLVIKEGFKVVDLDLIFAIPGQTEANLLNDIKTAFDCGATQVSTYPFIDFTFADNQFKALDEKEKRKMLHALAKYCYENNINRTSVWTFGKKGCEKYSSVTREAYLGFGLSATTLLNDTFKINTHSLHGYVERVGSGLLPTSLTLEFTKRQRAVYYLFWGSYALKISREQFEELFGVPLEKMFGLELLLAGMLGLIRKNGATYDLTDKGAILFHSVEQFYTRAYIDKMWNISRKQAFPDRIILK